MCDQGHVVTQFQPGSAHRAHRAERRHHGPGDYRRWPFRQLKKAAHQPETHFISKVAIAQQGFIHSQLALGMRGAEALIPVFGKRPAFQPVDESNAAMAKTCQIAGCLLDRAKIVDDHKMERQVRGGPAMKDEWQAELREEGNAIIFNGR